MTFAARSGVLFWTIDKFRHLVSSDWLKVPPLQNLTIWPYLTMFRIALPLKSSAFTKQRSRDAIYVITVRIIALAIKRK